MRHRGTFNIVGILPLFLSSALLTAVIGLAMAAGGRATGVAKESAWRTGNRSYQGVRTVDGQQELPKSPLGAEQVWYGLYTDATSYAPGDAIEIYASAPSTGTVFRLVRLDAAWTEITRTQLITVGPQTSAVGSFIEYPGLSLSGQVSFTLEGWYHPTLLGGDLAVIAGQVGLTEAAAGIILSTTGQIGAYVSDSPDYDLSKAALAPEPIDFEAWLDQWYHLALTYDGANANLFVNGIIAASRPQTGTVATVGTHFRLGARAEAPGDLTGVIDGRLDSWAVWPRALSQSEVQDRRDLGLATADPAPGKEEVELYVGFDGAYPSVGDISHNGYTATIYNHGNPGVSGVYTETGRAIRLNHDQIVDAGWDVTAAITIPAGTPSGMYAIQTLSSPFSPTQKGPRLSVRAIAIRPPAGGPHAPIAVILPTNTWNAYTAWPGTAQGIWPGFKTTYGPDTITERRRYPGSAETVPTGNNSAYGKMGDGVSLSYFHGWQRPSYEASPMPFDPDRGYLSLRAPNSMYLVQWLDTMGFDYDVYSDDDFDAGLITAANHRVLLPHSHHEYWSDGMLTALTQFLEDGGSVAAPAGNIFTWRVVYGENRVVEVRKISKAPILGLADLQSGIDGLYMSTLLISSVCNGNNDIYYGQPRHKALGVVTHGIAGCSNQPFCYGQWAARNADHWLWQGSDLSNDDLFGQGSVANAFAVGHEMDTWVHGMPLPGLAPGQLPVILGEGTAFDPGDLPGGKRYPDGHPDNPNPTPTTCKEINDDVPQDDIDETSTVGTILYFRHSGGGHVLVIGATATPWALDSDPALSGLLYRGLNCFAYGQGCGYEIYLPAVLRKS